jgi:hypothetical protein
MIPQKSSCLLFIIMLCFALGLRAGEKQNILLDIKPVFEGKAIAIGTATYQASTGDTVSIERFRFYVSQIILTLENGQRYAEPNSYHLIDAEDPNSFLVSLPNVPAGKIAAIRFNIGVDSLSSVSGALSGALDPVKGMYWAWNSGYINAKLEGACKTNNGKKNHVFEFHIGGYLPPYPALRSVELALPHAKDGKIVLHADASAWLRGVDLHREQSVLIPGKEAAEMADKYSTMFTLANE